MYLHKQSICTYVIIEIFALRLKERAKILFSALYTPNLYKNLNSNHFIFVLLRLGDIHPLYFFVSVFSLQCIFQF